LVVCVVSQRDGWKSFNSARTFGLEAATLEIRHAGDIWTIAAPPGAKRGMARWTADRAVDKIRNRFGWEAVEYGSALGLSLSVPDEFRELAEKDL